MSKPTLRVRCIGLLLAICLGGTQPPSVWALDRTWVGGNNDWIDGGATANWNPADEPDADDAAIFNTANSVNLGSNNTVNGLTMSGGIDLSTNGFDLLVDGLVQLTGNSTNLFIGGAASEVNADDITINSGGAVELTGGTLVVDDEALLAAGVLAVNSGGMLVGHGTINLVDSPLLAASLLNNNGTLTALSRPANILLPPPLGTLTINAGAANARIDLDGSGETGALSVNRNQTLDINGAIADAFNGTLLMAQNSTLDISGPWTLGAGGVINVDNGAVGGFPGVPAGTSTIAGGTLTQTGGTFTVVDADGVLDFNAPFTQTGGTFTNNGRVIFNANASIGTANFDFDAGEWTVQNNALLTINVTDYDPGVANNSFDSEITLNSADINVNTGDAAFVMNGVLNMSSNVAGLVTAWEGEPVVIGDDIGALNAHVNVSGTGISRFSTSVRVNADAKIAVAAGATLDFTGSVLFQSVNGGNQAEFAGSGTARFNSSVTVVEATTLNMAGGTVDLDGLDAVGDQITLQASLTINAATMSSFGNVNSSGVNVILIDASSAGATGSLTVNLDNPNAEWTLNPQGSMALFSNSLATLLHGSDVNLNGSVTVTGAVGSAARVDIGGTMNLQTVAGGFLLQGGTLADPNRIEGGQINGPGELQASGARALVGFGTIHAPIDFDGSAQLVAEGGQLNVNGAVEDVGLIRVSGSPAVLNFGTPFNTAVTDGGIVMSGGTLQGSAVTTTLIEKSIRGTGMVTSAVMNGGAIEAQGGTLQFNNPASDWDGASNAGHLRAVGGGTLHLLDNATFGFTGSVIAVENSRVFADGFALDFNPGSGITLTQGTYESTSSTDIGGTVIVGAGASSTIKVTNNFFLTFETGSATTLNGNLRLQNNNINIEQGATFSGAGALVIPDGSHLVADSQANIGVLLDMQGAFRPGNFDGVGRVDLLDYQQADTGELFVELTGTSLNAFDRLVVGGDVVLDGYLNIDIDGGFVPVLGNTFNIITGNTVSGQFDFADISGMPSGLTFAISYLPNAVQLQVVNTPFFSADFDEDGDVDATDLAIWRGAFNLNQLGDADGDNDSDGEDFLLWQQQFGSHAGAGAALGAAVPEPASALLLVLGLAGAVGLSNNRCRARFGAVSESGVSKASALTAIACVGLLLAHSKVSYGQTIDISLNLQYTMPSDPAMGGNWTLVAKTNSANGIGSISAILSNVNAAGIAYQSGIGAMLKGGSPFVVQNGSLVELLYAQEVSNPASVVTDVGRGAGTPGNLAVDPFNDPAWHNAAVIATGTFGDTRPAFTANLDTPPDVTKGNVLTTKTPPFFMAAAATVTTVVRDSLSVTPVAGDYNQNGTVDAADYVVWRKTLNQMVTPSSGADGNGNGTIDDADYGVWRANFGKPAGSGATLHAIAAVPEPAAWILFSLGALCLHLLRR